MSDNKKQQVAPTVQPTQPAGIITMQPGIYQQALFPIEIIETYPSNEGTADLTTIGKGQNSKHYAIKRISDGNGFVPASEFFCYELARHVSIATPDYDYLSLPKTEIAFGSVWEGGVHSLNKNNDVIDILENTVIVDDLERFFGKVYAFDLFVNNEDRHFGNYIFRESFGKTKIALAFDFSRAWKETDPFGYSCLQSDTRTKECHEAIKDYGRFDHAAALDTLEKIRAIDKEIIVSIMENMHSSWMSKSEKKVIIDWWGSEPFHERIDKLKGVI